MARLTIQACAPRPLSLFVAARQSRALALRSSEPVARIAGLMPQRTAKPVDAQKLLDSRDGWTYLDVRTVDEFQGGHPVGAWNIPVAVRGPAGMQPSAEFMSVVQHHFEKDAKILVGCASGARSMHACEMLTAAGFTNLVNVEGGFMGGRDENGQPAPGWAASGLPVEKVAPFERTFAVLRDKK